MSVEYNIYTVYEHDVDFLIMREIVSGGKLINELLYAADIPAGKPINIGNSVWDNELGETDILLEIDVDGTRYALLIENKINAPHQPLQYDRYLKRGQKGINNRSWDQFRVLLIAPEAYIAKEGEAKRYPYTYTYEQLRSYFDDGNHCFDVFLIERAIQKKNTSYDLIENEAVTEFWRQYLNYQHQRFPSLKCANSVTAKGTYSSWVQYHVGMKKELILYHKLTKGYIDLQFNNLAEREYELENLLKNMGINIYEEGISIVQTGKSASLRMVVEPVDITRSFEDVPDDIKECWFFALVKLSSLVERFDKEKLKEFIYSEKT